MFDRDLNAAFIFLCVVCAVVGWGVIEFLLWLFSHVSMSWAWWQRGAFNYDNFAKQSCL